MRRRSRDASIFSMSMMDVIAGAMGAFLILVVILSRHYVEQFIDDGDILELQKALVEATSDISEVSQRISGATVNTPVIEASLRSALRNVENSSHYVSQLVQEIDAANAHIARQQETIANQKQRLATYVPFLVIALWSCTEDSDVDLHVASHEVRSPNDPPKFFDPRKSQFANYDSEIREGRHGNGRGADVWSSGQSFLGESLKLFYRIDLEAGPASDCVIYSGVNTTTYSAEIPMIKLNAQQWWMFAGWIQIDEERRLSFVSPTEEQRRVEHELVRANNQL